MSSQKTDDRKSGKLERKLRLALSAANQGMWEWDIKKNHFEFDEPALNILGYSVRDLESGQTDGNWWIDQIYPDDRTEIKTRFNDFVTGKTDWYDVEFRIKQKNGQYIWISSKGKILDYDDQGCAATVIGVHQDITKLKRSSNDIFERENRYRTLFESAVDSIVVMDKDSFFSCNKATLKLFNCEREAEILGHHLNEFSPEYQPDGSLSNLKSAEYIDKALKGVPQVFEWQHLSKNGDLIDTMISLNRIYIRGKAFVQAIVRDISRQKHTNRIRNVLYHIARAVNETDNTKEMLEFIRNELSFIIDTTNFYVALYHHHSDTIKLLFCRDEKEIFTEFPAGKTLTQYVIRTGKPLIVDHNDIKQMERKGLIESVGPDSKIWLGVPLKVDNRVIGVLAVQSYKSEDTYNQQDLQLLEFVSGQVSQSIEKKQAQQDLLDALERAKESDKLKSAFLANMSHEIRTPMNGILGFAELLKEENLDKETQRDFVENINRSGQRMLNTINDLIDISRIEAGQMDVRPSLFNINALLDELSSFFSLIADKCGLALSCSKELPDSRCDMVADQEKVYEILTNLINNAIKYTNHGSVSFGYKLIDSQIEFYVKDTGIGIPEKMQKSIFDRFTQVDMSMATPYEGSGLGLPITKAYAQLLGGDIFLESEAGKGSVFYFRLPFRQRRE